MRELILMSLDRQAPQPAQLPQQTKLAGAVSLSYAVSTPCRRPCISLLAQIRLRRYGAELSAHKFLV
jgi:hypothetical protein